MSFFVVYLLETDGGLQSVLCSWQWFRETDEDGLWMPVCAVGPRADREYSSLIRETEWSTLTLNRRRGIKERLPSCTPAESVALWGGLRVFCLCTPPACVPTLHLCKAHLLFVPFFLLPLTSTLLLYMSVCVFFRCHPVSLISTENCHQRWHGDGCGTARHRCHGFQARRARGGKAASPYSPHSPSVCVSQDSPTPHLPHPFVGTCA